MKRVHCLYRVSTKRQVDKTDENDIPMQRTACHDFAKLNKWRITKEFNERGISGFKVSAAKRDSIQDLKTAAEKQEFDILLVYMFDRIGRIDNETPFVVEWFVRHGIGVWSVREGEQRFDSHVDKLTNYIRFWQANGESQKTSIRVKDCMNQLTEQGIYTGGVTPFGYKTVPSGRFNKSGKELVDLVIDPSEAHIIRLIFDKTVREGYGSHRIASMLNSMNIKTHNRSGFQCNTINRILKYRYVCNNKWRQRGVCDGQSAYIADRIDNVMDNIVCEYLFRINAAPKSVVLERRYQTEIAEMKTKKREAEQEIKQWNERLAQLTEEIPKSLMGKSTFAPDILSMAIDSAKTKLQNTEDILAQLNHNLSDSQSVLKKLNFHYEQFRSWSEVFKAASLEERKMIICQLIREINVSRGYKMYIVLDMSYEQFFSTL
jgi:DNA invertase Pin-like site-specific DNA recombinase